MVYRPAFVRWQRPDLIGRSARRAAVLAPRRGRFDVTGVTLTVPPAQRARLAEQLQAAGFARRDTGPVTRLAGQGWMVTLHPGTVRTSLHSIDLRLTGRAATNRLLGSTKLISDDAGRATLRFADPPPTS